MPTTRRRRPPAVYRPTPVLQPEGFQAWTPISVGAGKIAAPGGLSGSSFDYHTQYVVNVNPIKEPPKPIVVSLANPISNAGWRRIVRTKMATPYLQRGSMDRVFHAGKMMGVRAERDKMRGAYSRGWTYNNPYPVTGPGPRVAPGGAADMGGGQRWINKVWDG